MTNNLEKRVYEHQHDLIDGFTKQYRCHRLVYFESYDRANTAIDREKQLKRWNRAKKLFLIERANPTWEDLSAEWGKQIDPLKQVLHSPVDRLCRPTGSVGMTEFVRNKMQCQSRLT
jgi:putative endonuclease